MIHKAFEGRFGACEKLERCTCGICPYLDPEDASSPNLAMSYKQKKELGKLLLPTTEGRQVGYKEPLSPVEDGFGYFGTLTIDVKTENYVQCHECGFYFLELGNHIRKHELSGRDYKAKYGLSIGTVLMSESYKMEFSKKRPFNYTEEHLKQTHEARKKALESIALSDKIGRDNYRLEYYNRFGICPDQILDKYNALKESLGRDPSYRELSREYNTGLPQLLMRMFGSSWAEVSKEIANMSSPA